MNDQDRERLVEAMASEDRKHDWIPRGACHCGWEAPDIGYAGKYAAWRAHVMDANLSAALAVCRPVPCPEPSCVNGKAGMLYDGPQHRDCPVCHGSGSVPGPSSLLMVRGELEEVCWHSTTTAPYWMTREHAEANVPDAFPVYRIVDAGVSVPTPETCPECGGDGLDGSHEAALYYADRGDISYCEACNGSGFVPTPKEGA